MMASQRNDPCPCGSGKKYKKCCLNNLPQHATNGVAGENLEPSQLVLARAQAFDANDFGFIYDTFHPDSNFRRQFPERSDYLAYGLATLNNDYRIDECRILEQRLDSLSAWVLFYLNVAYRGQCQAFFELSEFKMVAKHWRYLSSYKLECSDFTGSIEEITMAQVRQNGTYF